MQVEIIVASITAAGAIALYGIRRYTERSAVNKAILAEISRLLSILCGHKKLWFERKAKGEQDFPLIPFSTDVYDKTITNMGDLDRGYVAEAARFYGTVKFLNSLQRARKKYVAGGKAALFEDDYGTGLERILKNYSTTFDPYFKKYNIRKPGLKNCLPANDQAKQE